MRRGVLLLAAILGGLGACERVSVPGRADARFGDGTDVGELRGANLREASGMVASQRFPGRLWLQNDSGNDPELFLVDSTGAVEMRLRIDGVANRDWEDLARHGDTVFIAEMGDNLAQWDTVWVYAVVEPATRSDTVATPVARYPFAYPDGPRDAEALLVDPRTGDWFVVSKREEHSRLYRYPAPQRASRRVTLERLPLEFPFRLAVGADISADGRDVVVKTYDAVYLWERADGETIPHVLTRAPLRQPYTPERQGEAIAFALNGSAYFTTSEVELDVPQLLLRYPRITASNRGAP